MKSILKTVISGKTVEVFLITPEKIYNQFDFIEVQIDGVAFDLANGFIHGTKLRSLGVLCKQTCIGLTKEILFTVKDSKAILYAFNLHLLSLFENKSIPFKCRSASGWMSGFDISCVDVHSTAIQALYYYFKRSANVNEPNHVLCTVEAKLSEMEAGFLGEFLSCSPYLLGKADALSEGDHQDTVHLAASDVYHTLKLAVIQINNFRNGCESVMDAKHPTLSPLFIDNGPSVMSMDDQDIPL